MKPIIYEVSAPSRIHLGLIALTNESKRAYGGAGIAISHYRTIVQCQAIESDDIVILGVASELSSKLKLLIKESSITGVQITVEAKPPSHIGVGSGTSLRLAVLEAAFLASKTDYTQLQLVLNSCRGGASGIGVSSYFRGGFLIDLGHKREVGQLFTPSSLLEPNVVPKLLNRCDWPSCWPITIAYPQTNNLIFGKDELDFFRSKTPFSLSECALSAFSLIFELTGGIEEVDFDAVKSALYHSRCVSLKKCEIERFPEVKKLLDFIDENTEVAGTMSSLGPAIAIIGKNYGSFNTLNKSIPPGWVVVHDSVDNSGRTIRTV